MYLLYCFVAGNQLSGTIPTELGSLEGLTYVDLGKSATMSSSELETITLFGSTVSYNVSPLRLCSR
jgi:hypothetical protein